MNRSELTSATLGLPATFPVTTEVDRDQERELVERAKTDPAAFGELYDRYLPKIYGFLLRRVQSKELAEDLTSTTFEKAIRALPRFTWRGVTFSAWLYRIAANALTDHFRAQSKKKTVSLDEFEIPLPDDRRTDEPAVRQSDRQALEEAMTKIPERYRRALELKFFDELTNDEMAQTLGVSKGTLAVLVYRSLKSLRSVLGPNQTDLV